MDLISLFTQLGGAPALSILLITVLSLVQISPLKINPWIWLNNILLVPVRAFGKIMYSSLDTSIESMKNQLENTISELEKVNNDIGILKSTMDEDRAIRRRVRILRFGDEIRSGQPHSLEHFDEVLSDISAYKDYCNQHTDFKNSKAVATIKCIEKDYQKRLVNNDFL